MIKTLILEIMETNKTFQKIHFKKHINKFYFKTDISRNIYPLLTDECKLYFFHNDSILLLLIK